MASKDLKTFTGFASDLHADVIRDYGATDARLTKTLSFEERDSDGWAVTLLEIGSGKPRLEVWYDHLMLAPKRSLWVGLYCKSTGAMHKYFSALSIDIEKRLLVEDKDLIWKSARRIQYAGGVARTRFEKLYGESYGVDGQFAGRYFFGDLSANQGRFRVEAGAFLSVLLAGVEGRDDDPDLYPGLSGKEGRRIAVTHMRRERVTALATAAKKRDKHICRVCDLQFTDRYGILGKGFAEAHHVIPLNKGSSGNRVGDLGNFRALEACM